MTADETILKEWFFDKERTNVLFPLVENKLIGFCLYFYNVSTYLVRSGLYIEDSYIEEKYWRTGYGKELLHKIFEIVKEEKLGTVE
ncbi:GNAT family N-acetyltransferase [Enterococcus sp. CWB-B31]|nr:GNAT family N-acetyltransferase [Enterococcus sp. CWB-B31]